LIFAWDLILEVNPIHRLTYFLLSDPTIPWFELPARKMHLRILWLASGLLTFVSGSSCPFGHDNPGKDSLSKDRAMLLEAIKRDPAAATEILAAYRERGEILPADEPVQPLEAREKVNPLQLLSLAIECYLRIE
jgi:hypothetical protein